MLIHRLRRRIEKSLDWLKGWFHAHITLSWHRLAGKPIRDITRFARRLPFIERREFSQNDEDGIIHAIFAMIGVTNRYYVEFGAEDGVQCNTRALRLFRGWQGLLLDGEHEDPAINLHRAFITVENIEELFRQYAVPAAPDILSIDIDGNDYWVWKAITHWRPRVVIIEYNAHIPPEESRTIPYDPRFLWDKTDYYGASLLALKRLGEQKGYALIGTDPHGVNAFFVLRELAKGAFSPPPWPATYHSPAFKGKQGNAGRHPHDPLGRPWVTV
ncbi:MAG: hypothetical protein PHI23_02225 [Candidatus Peribacteraceae bacterium]|nr:hypothetical protein [Candidatus Peribacteraceae bacterium]